VKFKKPVKTAKKIARELKKDHQADVVICLSHSGIKKNAEGEWEGEDIVLAKKVKDIDVIISGHSHTFLPDPVHVNGTPILQTGSYGASLGKLSLLITPDSLKIMGYEMLKVNDKIKGAKDIQDAIEVQQKKINQEILVPLGISYEKLVVETSFDLICDEKKRLENSNLGPFIVDAMHAYVNDKTTRGADIAMIAAGGIRADILKGQQAIPDLFRVVSLGKGSDSIPGYPLALVHLTAKELKKIFELLLAVYPSDKGVYTYLSGLQVYYDPDRPLFRKIQKMELTGPGGKPTEMDYSRKNDSLYSLLANAYMLEFVGMIRRMSVGIVNVKPMNAEGEPYKEIQKSVIDMDPSTEIIEEGKEWTALQYYVGTFPDVDGNGVPDIPEKYRDIPSRFIKVDK
jgi:5'-nucleotidase